MWSDEARAASAAARKAAGGAAKATLKAKGLSSAEEKSVKNTPLHAKAATANREAAAAYRKAGNHDKAAEHEKRAEYHATMAGATSGAHSPKPIAEAHGATPQHSGQIHTPSSMAAITHAAASPAKVVPKFYEGLVGLDGRRNAGAYGESSMRSSPGELFGGRGRSHR